MRAVGHREEDGGDKEWSWVERQRVMKSKMEHQRDMIKESDRAKEWKGCICMLCVLGLYVYYIRVFCMINYGWIQHVIYYNKTVVSMYL